MLFNGGLTINPDGRIVLCCVSTQKELAHISDIKDLNEFYNSSLLNEIRETMKSGSLPEDWCFSCINWRKNGERAAIDDWVKREIEWNPDDVEYHTINFLEFAPSNICNQNCAMCGSVYSSKWIEWDNDAIEDGLTFRFKKPWHSYVTNFHNEVWSMDDKDLQKIYDVLPNVRRINLKGGEPFADKRNYDLIRHCIKLKNPPVIAATTNFSTIPNEIMDLICDYPKFRMGVSIDGTDKVYEWVRGASYKQTIDNCHTYMKRSDNGMLVVTATPTIYTLYSLDDYMLEMKSLGFKRMQFMSCTSPKYVSVEAEENIEHYNEKYKRFLASYDKVHIHNPENLYKRKYDVSIKKSHVRDWIEFMNKKRGFDIRDHVLELNKF
mgnify:FL=1